MSSLNLATLAKPLVGGKLTLANAIEIAERLIDLVEMAETVLAGLKGNEKAQIVLEAAEALLKDILPDEAEEAVKAFRKRLKPVVNIIVAVYRLKNLWPAIKAAA